MPAVGWQDVAVWIVVGGAVLFLIGRNLNFRKRRKKPAETFIPLSSLKKPAPPPDSGRDAQCH
jgi:hypothetical protein